MISISNHLRVDLSVFTAVQLPPTPDLAHVSLDFLNSLITQRLRKFFMRISAPLKKIHHIHGANLPWICIREIRYQPFPV